MASNFYGLDPFQQYYESSGDVIFDRFGNKPPNTELVIEQPKPGGVVSRLEVAGRETRPLNVTGVNIGYIVDASNFLIPGEMPHSTESVPMEISNITQPRMEQLFFQKRKVPPRPEVIDGKVLITNTEMQLRLSTFDDGVRKRGIASNELAQKAERRRQKELLKEINDDISNLERLGIPRENASFQQLLKRKDELESTVTPNKVQVDQGREIIEELRKQNELIKSQLRGPSMQSPGTVSLSEEIVFEQNEQKERDDASRSFEQEQTLDNLEQKLQERNISMNRELVSRQLDQPHFLREDEKDMIPHHVTHFNQNQMIELGDFMRKDVFTISEINDFVRDTLKVDLTREAAHQLTRGLDQSIFRGIVHPLKGVLHKGEKVYSFNQTALKEFENLSLMHLIAPVDEETEIKEEGSLIDEIDFLEQEESKRVGCLSVEEQERLNLLNTIAISVEDISRLSDDNKEVVDMGNMIAERHTDSESARLSLFYEENVFFKSEMNFESFVNEMRIESVGDEMSTDSGIDNLARRVAEKLIVFKDLGQTTDQLFEEFEEEEEEEKDVERGLELFKGDIDINTFFNNLDDIGGFGFFLNIPETKELSNSFTKLVKSLENNNSINAEMIRHIDNVRKVPLGVGMFKGMLSRNVTVQNLDVIKEAGPSLAKIFNILDKQGGIPNLGETILSSDLGNKFLQNLAGVKFTLSKDRLNKITNISKLIKPDGIDNEEIFIKVMGVLLNTKENQNKLSAKLGRKDFNVLLQRILIKNLLTATVV